MAKWQGVNGRKMDRQLQREKEIIRSVAEDKERKEEKRALG